MLLCRVPTRNNAPIPRCTRNNAPIPSGTWNRNSTRVGAATKGSMPLNANYLTDGKGKHRFVEFLSEQRSSSVCMQNSM